MLHFCKVGLRRRHGVPSEYSDKKVLKDIIDLKDFMWYWVCGGYTATLTDLPPMRTMYMPRGMDGISAAAPRYTALPVMS